MLGLASGCSSIGQKKISVLQTRKQFKFPFLLFKHLFKSVFEGKQATPKMDVGLGKEVVMQATTVGWATVGGDGFEHGGWRCWTGDMSSDVSGDDLCVILAAGLCGLVVVSYAEFNNPYLLHRMERRSLILFCIVSLRLSSWSQFKLVRELVCCGSGISLVIIGNARF